MKYHLELRCLWSASFFPDGYRTVRPLRDSSARVAAQISGLRNVIAWHRNFLQVPKLIRTRLEARFDHESLDYGSRRLYRRIPRKPLCGSRLFGDRDGSG